MPRWCVHGDLLDMDNMVPSWVPTYLKADEFLEGKTCAWIRGQTVQEIYDALSRNILHYCDIGKKGFYAPDDDTLKSTMECGLVLCFSCFENRRVKYEEETGAANGDGRRKRRRSHGQ